MNNKVLITGSTGFIGSALVDRIRGRQFKQVVALTREPATVFPCDVLVMYASKKIDASKLVLQGIDSIVHCAARVHIMNDTSSDPLADFRDVNVKFTLDLARRAAASGVRRFVFISSVKVNGEETLPSTAFKSDDAPAPLDPYGQSKLEAEEGLRHIAFESGIEVVIIRPVLVYGPGVKANFLNMMQLLNKGVPLPLGAIFNKRSLVSLSNLIDLIITCIDHPDAANQTFMVSDGEDVSTTELLQRMAKALNRPARLIPVPTAVLKAGALLLGRRDVARRLTSSLQVNIDKTRSLLGWSPIESLDEGLLKVARSFIANS